MKVFCIGHSYVIASNRVIEREIARNCGIEITIGAPAHWFGDLRQVELEPEPFDSPIKLVPLKTLFKKSIHLFNYNKFQINREIRENIDGVHIWQEPYTRSCYLIARSSSFNRVPFTFFTAQNYNKNYPWPFCSWEKWVSEHANGWTGCGKLVMDTQIARGYRPEKSALLPHAVDTSQFYFRPPAEKAKIRNLWGFQGPVIGYVGRFVPEKGIQLILDMLKFINPNNWAGMVFLGSGPLEGEIRTWFKEKGWSDKLHIQLIKHGDMPAILPGLDVLVCASQTMPKWREQLGRMLIEAMASGIPVVASDSGEIPNTVGSGGIIFSEKNPKEAADAVTKLIEDKMLRDKIIHLGLEQAKKFDAKNIAIKMADFWRQSFL